MTFTQMKYSNPQMLDPNKLADITDITVNMDLSLRERLADYLEQIGNPYCFRCGKVVVKIVYADTDVTFEDALEQFIRERQLAQHGGL